MTVFQGQAELAGLGVTVATPVFYDVDPPIAPVQPTGLQEQTVNYKTYVKKAMIEAFSRVFNAHLDKRLQRTKVTIDFPVSAVQYPSLIVRFFERDLHNAGVGHEESIDEGFGLHRYKHYLYSGDLEFAVYTLSSLDRDLIADTVVQTLAMGDVESYTNRFFDRIYRSDFREEPVSLSHYINLNTDNIQGFGETQIPAPWQPEDVLVYHTSYRIDIYGEFYSRTPTETLSLIEDVVQYPYIDGVDPLPQGTEPGRAWWP